MKGILIYHIIQRDPFKGFTPDHTMEAVSKNRCSILAAVCIKFGSFFSVESEILEQCAYECMFTHFIRILIEKGVLSRGVCCCCGQFLNTHEG